MIKKLSLSKPFYLVTFIVLIGAGGAWIFFQTRSQTKSKTKIEVSSFEECLQADYFLIDSQPRQCKTPDGQVFVEEREEEGAKEKETSKPEALETYTDLDQVIEVQKGEKFQINLESNPTTGYRWDFDIEADFLLLVEQEFEPESDLIGAGGTETFQFSASTRGETKIRFFYHRPWEEQSIKEKIFKVKVF